MGWVDPITWSTGTALNATNLNTIRDSLNEVGDPGTTYTTTWTGSTTNPTIGNGSMLSTYRQVGSWVDFEIAIVFGSTSSAGAGTYAWTLPPGTTISNYPALFGGGFVQNGSSFYGRTLAPVTGTAVALVDGAANRVSATSPVALASGMRLYLGGRYQTT